LLQRTHTCRSLFAANDISEVVKQKAKELALENPTFSARTIANLAISKVIETQNQPYRLCSITQITKSVEYAR
jgi:hypothetical protein